MKIPKPLKSGSTIAITAPSFGCTTEPYLSRYREAVRLFEERGYKVVSGATVSKDDGIGISTSPQFAAAELMEFYLDPSIDAVISAGGGELMCETLSFIDFKRLKDAPASGSWAILTTPILFFLLQLCPGLLPYTATALPVLESLGSSVSMTR